ncbi:hypothetical protein CEUSTIGMA_g4115.t1 [Chlamydomonas eustigma]|uniref:Dynein assembly factor 1, axonemal homolog n=1 Tax=Chlamydomonas eustigma TaxID=1157962 RepID=A0A250X162_9CHLO|nr:hypothetical protein CEUSTIGMA_g4115.t1 [Chlamydomonas eustigma]|eukprot:GAX76669.1 hypothetical protein CEUSTIGMA_g4115.t1 [Chlamydomonas eustigma]
MSGPFVLTSANLRKLCKELKLYTSAPELNEVLHLQCKSIVKLENLEDYTGLTTLYLNQNAISTIEGLDKLVNLRCLYISKNCLECISGLDNLLQLDSLDVSDNYIKTVSGLDHLPALRSLNLSGNKLRTLDNIEHLSRCTSVTSLDLANNKLEENEAVDLLAGMPLSLLRLMGNPIVGSYKHYRKRLLSGMLSLKYLDESPVFPKDHRLAIAFMDGGIEAERAMRELIREEEEQTRERHRKAFDDMVEKARSMPPQPHDPMRFRAVPPGESESDEEGLPPSHRNPSKAKKKAASASSGASAAVPNASLQDKSVEESSITAVLEEYSMEGAREAEGVDSHAVVCSGSALLKPDEDQGHQTSSADPANDNQIACSPSQAGHSQQGTEDDDIEQDFNTQLQNRAIARAAARAEAAMSIYESQAGTEGISTLGAASIADIEGYLGSGNALVSASPVAAAAAAAAAAARSARPASRPPKVWGTSDYRRLWQMAVEVGEQQEQQQQGDGGSNSSTTTGTSHVAILTTTEVGGSAAFSGSSSTVHTAHLTTGTSIDPRTSVPEPAAAAAVGRVIADSALSEADLDSARAHSGIATADMPDIDMDSARDGLADADVDDSAHSSDSGHHFVPTFQPGRESADPQCLSSQDNLPAASDGITHLGDTRAAAAAVRGLPLSHQAYLAPLLLRQGDTDSARDGGSDVDVLVHDGSEEADQAETDDDDSNMPSRDLFERYTITSYGQGGRAGTAAATQMASSGGSRHTAVPVSVQHLRQDVHQDSATSLMSLLGEVRGAITQTSPSTSLVDLQMSSMGVDSHQRGDTYQRADSALDQGGEHPELPLRTAEDPQLIELITRAVDLGGAGGSRLRLGSIIGVDLPDSSAQATGYTAPEALVMSTSPIPQQQSQYRELCHAPSDLLIQARALVSFNSLGSASTSLSPSMQDPYLALSGQLQSPELLAKARASVLGGLGHDLTLAQSRNTSLQRSHSVRSVVQEDNAETTDPIDSADVFLHDNLYELD